MITIILPNQAIWRNSYLYSFTCLRIINRPAAIKAVEKAYNDATSQVFWKQASEVKTLTLFLIYTILFMEMKINGFRRGTYAPCFIYLTPSSKIFRYVNQALHLPLQVYLRQLYNHLYYHLQAPDQ
jgi:hypothetical protein